MNDATLLAYMVGALDPGAALDVEARLRIDPILQARLTALQQPSQPQTIRWSIPPPGVPGGRAAVGMSARSMSMSAGPIQALEGFSIHIEPVASASTSSPRTLTVCERWIW